MNKKGSHISFISNDIVVEPRVFLRIDLCRSWYCSLLNIVQLTRRDHLEITDHVSAVGTVLFANSFQFGNCCIAIRSQSCCVSHGKQNRTPKSLSGKDSMILGRLPRLLPSVAPRGGFWNLWKRGFSVVKQAQTTVMLILMIGQLTMEARSHVISLRG